MLFRLPQRLQASQVEEVLADFKRAAPGERVEVDVSEVSKVDTAGLQLLVSLSLTHRPLWVGTSKALCDAARCLGLDAPLGLPQGAP